jgi:hypothetical protein
MKTQVSNLLIQPSRTLITLSLGPEVEASNHILAGFVLVSVQNLTGVSTSSRAQDAILELTSLVLECNIRTFFPVIT